MRDLFRAFGRILELELFRIGTTEVTVSTLLAVMALLVSTVWLSGRTRRLVEAIAFPQVDLHLDPEVNDSIRQLAGRAA